jgi:HEPN domain-containing protein
MATRLQLQELALLRLQEAEGLYASGHYEGCAYLCGYVVELALKAKICAAFGVTDYPEKGSRLREALKSHSLDDLGLVAGMEHEFTLTRPELLANWSIVNQWRPEWRYEPKGSYDRKRAEKLLDAVRTMPDGVLTCISARW